MTKTKEADWKVFPLAATAEDCIPETIWPSLKGVQNAKQKEYPNTLAAWKTFWALAAKQSIISIDTETSGLRAAHGDKIVGVAAAFYDKKVIHCGYWNFRHIGHKAHGTCKGYKETAAKMPVSCFTDISKVHAHNLIAGQNYKFDIKMFWNEGVGVPERVLDTMLIAHLWDENKRYYNLAALGTEMGETKLADTIKAYMALHELEVEGHGHEQVPYEVERPYAIADTVIVLKRLQFERDRWETLKDPRLMEVFQIEMAQTPAAAKMEIDGIQLDIPFVKRSVDFLKQQVEMLQKAIYHMAGKEFDIASNPQLWAILEAKGFKPFSMTAKGAVQLDDNALTSYKDPLCDLIKEYRGRSKALGTYFQPFLEVHSDKEGKLHPDFFIHGTVSGRMSCREPNLQNISRFEKFSARVDRGSLAKSIQEGLKFESMITADALETRRAFIPRSNDHSLFYFDYSQMELRVFAEVAEEEFLLKTLEEGGDLHEATARSVFPNFPTKEKNKTLFTYFRQLAKQINFGIIYGMGKNKLAYTLSVPVDESVRAIELALLCFKEMPGCVKDFTMYTVAELLALKEDHRVNTELRQKGWGALRVLRKTVEENIDIVGLTKLLVSDEKNIAMMYSADTFLKSYHAKFPRIKMLTKKIDETISSRGYIFNRFGRRYHLTSDKSYIGVNRWVQGSCSDMVKLATARVHKLFNGKKTLTINQVHDEFQIDMYHHELDLIPRVKEMMEYYPTVKVKMTADCDYSHVAWSDKHEWSDAKEFFDSDKRKYSAEKKALLKKQYGWAPAKAVKK